MINAVGEGDLSVTQNVCTGFGAHTVTLSMDTDLLS